MAKKKIATPSLEAFTKVSNIKNSSVKENRNIKEELFNKNWQADQVDSFERALGINTKAGESKVEYKHKVKIFQPSADKDRDLLTELMNSPKHKITYWKDNWTALGEYLIFVVYTEEVKKED